MEDAFNRFTLWLNGKCGEESREIAEQVKYVIIAGDIVDGVGVYPRQINDLVVEELSEQYELASKFLEQIPDYIDVIIIPGNHDATRRALPQPALTKEYIEPLMENRNTLSLGNPANIRIHGVEFLLYHGRSLDDVLATVPGMEFHSPERAMRLMLRSRHLAPIYGQRTLISPGNRDFLVIERVPDVFHSGHVHVMKYESYRGTVIVNSGAWQRQTNYQKNLGLEPTPGIIPVLNLEDLSITPMDFN
jgi:DNA polymerase II small subunit